MLITGNSPKLIETTKNQLNKMFKMKDLGELKYFLGIEFNKSTKGILMNQRKYVLELIDDIGLSAENLFGLHLNTIRSSLAKNWMILQGCKMIMNWKTKGNIRDSLGSCCT